MRQVTAQHERHDARIVGSTANKIRNRFAHSSRLSSRTLKAKSSSTPSIPPSGTQVLCGGPISRRVQGPRALRLAWPSRLYTSWEVIFGRAGRDTHDEQIVSALVDLENHCLVMCRGLTWTASANAGQPLG
jgi:hypothetical protein